MALIKTISNALRQFKWELDRYPTGYVAICSALQSYLDRVANIYSKDILYLCMLISFIKEIEFSLILMAFSLYLMQVRTCIVIGEVSYFATLSR